MRISDWSSDVCSSDLVRHPCERLRPLALVSRRGSAFRVPGWSLGLGLGTRLALRPQGKVYTILIRGIKKNRIIFAINIPQFRGKLTINPIYIREQCK